jgi:hypothetical protein
MSLRARGKDLPEVFHKRVAAREDGLVPVARWYDTGTPLKQAEG